MTSILRQKLKQPAAIGTGKLPDCGRTIEKAVSLAGLGILDIQIEAKAGVEKFLKPSELVNSLFDKGLNLLITGTNLPYLGLVCLQPELICALTDIQTGNLEPDGPAPEPRKPTRTDAALCQVVINEILTQIDTVFAKKNPSFQTIGFHISGQDADPSAHLFPDIDHMSLTIDLDFCEGARVGQFTIAVPLGAWGQGQADDFLPKITRPDPVWQAALHQSVAAASAQFDAILHRKKMPIGEVMRLKKGDVLEFPAAALDGLRLEAHGSNGKNLMTARLGEYQEMRAARISRIGPANGSQAQPEKLTKLD